MCSTLLLSGSNHNKVEETFGRYARITANTDYTQYFRQLVGDTITMNFNEQYLSCFRTTEPDTIWIKKRPKKNPIEGKHYTLKWVYKGIAHNGRTVTPASEINGKQFAVYTVKAFDPVTKSFVIDLIDLTDIRVVEFRISNLLIPNFDFTSVKIHNSISQLIGTDIYYNTSNIFDNHFKRYTVKDGSHAFHLHRPQGNRNQYVISFDFALQLQDADGNTETATLSKSSSGQSKFMTPDEFAEANRSYEINSIIDPDLLNKRDQLPFQFDEIPVASGRQTAVYQKIPAQITSDAILDNCNMYIVDVVNVDHTDYYKCCYNGKAFFVKAKNLKLSDESKSRLDTLMGCPLEVRDIFLHHTLDISKKIFDQTQEKYLDQYTKLRKYGIGILEYNAHSMSIHTTGTGLYIKFMNPASSTIKYVTLTCQGYNSVDDPTGSLKKVTMTGPVKEGKTAAYNFDYLWLNHYVDYVKLRSLTIQYMDDTTKHIANPDNVMVSQDFRDWLSSPNPVKFLK